jgi:hypothetical protein
MLRGIGDMPEECLAEVDVAPLVTALRNEASATSAEELCVALCRGGHAAAEAACQLGAVEAAAALLCKRESAEAYGLEFRAIEALWYLVDDFDSCQALIRCGGQSQVVKLAREKGSQDASFACSALRLLTETLYGEARNAALWHADDMDFVIDALSWALTADISQAHVADPACGFLCDIAALWVQRCGERSIELAKALVGLIPLLLQKMAARTDDVVLLQHGCRLVSALATRSCYWPEDMRQATLSALAQLSPITRMSADAQVSLCGNQALKAVATLPERLPEVTLSAMD